MWRFFSYLNQRKANRAASELAKENQLLRQKEIARLDKAAAARLAKQVGNLAGLVLRNGFAKAFTPYPHRDIQELSFKVLEMAVEVDLGRQAGKAHVALSKVSELLAPEEGKTLPGSPYSEAVRDAAHEALSLLEGLGSAASLMVIE